MQLYQRFLLYQELRMALHSLVQYGLALMRQLAFGAEQKATALILLAHCLHTSGDLATTAAYQLLGKEIEVIMMCTWRNLLVTEQARFLFGGEFFTSEVYNHLWLECIYVLLTMTGLCLTKVWTFELRVSE